MATAKIVCSFRELKGQIKVIVPLTNALVGSLSTSMENATIVEIIWYLIGIMKEK